MLAPVLLASLAAPLRLASLAAALVAPVQDLPSIEQKLRTGKDNEKVDALFDAAKKLGTIEALRLIPPFFDYPNVYVSDRAIAAFSEAKDAAPFAAAAKEFVAAPKTKIRAGILEALARTRLPAPAELLAPALADPDPEIRSLALHVLIAHPPATAPAAAAKLASAQERDPKVRATALWALGAMGDAAAGTAARKDKDPAARIGALLALEAAKGSPAAAIESLGDGDRRVRLAALAWIARARPGDAVPPLIANLGKEAGRLREECLRALKTITLRDFGYDAKAWTNWWEPVAKGFTPPALPNETKDKKMGQPVEASAPGGTKADAPKYHEFTVRSDRVAFLVDVSGSMRAKYKPPGETAAGEGAERSKLETAAEALREVVASLPKGTLVSVVVFNSAPLAYHSGARGNDTKGGAQSLEASAKLADDLKKYVLAIGASNATNISDSLELVIDDPDVDTIYLLTDGAPSAGKRMLASRIVEWVRRSTALSRTQVNTIALGASDRDFDFLKKLAEASGGSASRR